MERIIDISNKDNRLWAEDEGYLSDFADEPGYLFSVAVPVSSKEPCRIFYKDYPKAENPFKGKYYITLPIDYDAELHCTKDYNQYVEWNIEEGYFGDEVRSNYNDTLILDMGAMTAVCKNEEHHFWAIIKESAQEAIWQQQHEASFRQPY